jgi:hypothetical protein
VEAARGGHGASLAQPPALFLCAHFRNAFVAPCAWVFAWLA